MGVWAWGPFENDDGAGVVEGVRYLLDEAWGALRGDQLEDAGLALAGEAATIVAALTAAGIDVRPDDAEQLVEVWDDALPATVQAALLTTPPRVRPPFPDERAVERSLREARADYDVWMWAAAFGDERAAAWNAAVSPGVLLAFARAGGAAEEDISRALARALARTLRGEVEAPWPGVADALDRMGGEGIDKATLRWLVACQRELEEPPRSIDDILRNQQPRKPPDPREMVLALGIRLAKHQPFAKHHLDQVPELATYLRPYLELVFEV